MFVSADPYLRLPCRNRRRWAAAAAVAASGAAAAYYVYDRCSDSCPVVHTHCHSDVTVCQHLCRWGKLQEARASLQELEARHVWVHSLHLHILLTAAISGAFNDCLTRGAVLLRCAFYEYLQTVNPYPASVESIVLLSEMAKHPQALSLPPWHLQAHWSLKPSQPLQQLFSRMQIATLSHTSRACKLSQQQPQLPVFCPCCCRA